MPIIKNNRRRHLQQQQRRQNNHERSGKQCFGKHIFDSAADEPTAREEVF
jgi:hypothetical protein